VQAKGRELGEQAKAAAIAKGTDDPKALAAVAGPAMARHGQKVASEYTKVQEVGGLLGRCLMAVVLAGGLAWGWKLRLFQIPGLLLVPAVFWFFLRVPNTTFFEIPLESIHLGTIPVTTMSVGMFLIGLCTVAQLSFWGNYLPHVFPVHLRGTGESFAANIGGRMIGTSAAALTSALAGLMPGGSPPVTFSTAAALVGGLICLVGLAASFLLPEPSGDIDA
jgi:hypothetical protein